MEFIAQIEKHSLENLILEIFKFENSCKHGGPFFWWLEFNIMVQFSVDSFTISEVITVTEMGPHINKYNNK